MLNSPENSRLESIFGEARELVREQRQAYLDRACGDDVALRGRIESLLEAEGHCATEMLRRAAGLDYSAPAESLPIELDRYLLEERIGEGSFGVVYRASQRRSSAVSILSVRRSLGWTIPTSRKSLTGARRTLEDPTL